MTHDEWSAMAEINRDDATPPLDVLFDRYLAGEATPSECVVVERALAKSPNDAAFAELVIAWKQRRAPSTVNEARMHIARRLGGYPGAEGNNRQLKMSVRIRSPFRQRTAVENASVLGAPTLRRGLWSLGGAILAGLAFLILGSRQPSQDQGITHTYVTNRSKSATLTLGDGTRVTLAPQTTLRLVHFGPQSRTVILTGTALFDVGHASGTPFVVQSGVAKTRVLGTTFMVRYQDGDTKARVAVLSGKVWVMPRSRPQDGATLNAGQIGNITDSLAHVSNVDVNPSREWVLGQLVFRDTPIATILETLTQWYGYQFHCADPTLVRHRVTMGVSMQSSAEALAALEQVLNVNIAIHGDTVTLTPYAVRPGLATPRVHGYDVWSPTREVGR